MEINKIYQGDWIELAKQLDNNSIDLIMTSPPYWSLRDYGTEPIIFDADENCEHEWNSQTYTIGNKAGNKDKSLWFDGKPRNNIRESNQARIQTSDFCFKCNAWKGSLGLEPHPNLFIKHLVDGFRILKTKLKKSGSLYLNLGDTYFGSAQGYGQKPPTLNKLTDKWQRPSRDAFSEAMISKNCLLCEKEIKTGKGGQFCSRECLNKKGNDFRSQNKTNWLQPKQLMLMPSRIAIVLQDDGWICRSDTIWHKSNSMPSSAKDRVNNCYEHLFHFCKSKKYYFDLDSIRKPYAEGSLKRFDRKRTEHSAFNYRVRLATQNREEDYMIKASSKEKENYNEGEYQTLKAQSDLGSNPGNVWIIPSAQNRDFEKIHFAIFPEELCIMPILSSCPENGIVLDPFMGSGTTALVAKKLNRSFIGFELKGEYIKIANERLKPYLEQKMLMEMIK